MTTRGVEHVKRPIVPGATHHVECVCGSAFNAVAASGADAIAQLVQRHKHPGAKFSAVEIPAEFRLWEYPK